MSISISPMPPDNTPGRVFPRPALGLGIVYVALVFSALLVFLFEFTIPQVSGAMVGAGLGAAVFLAVAYLPKRRWPVLLCALGVWLIPGLVFLGVLQTGGTYGLQLLASRFSRAFIGLREIPPPTSPAGESAFWWVLAFAGYLLAGLISLAVLWFHSVSLTLLCTAPFLAAAFTWDFLPPLPPTVLLLGCWGALLAYGKPACKSAARHWLPLGALALCLAFLTGLAAGVPPQSYTQSPQVLQVRGRLQKLDFGGVLNNLFSGVGASADTEVNLAGQRNIRQTAGTAFYMRGRTSYGQHLRGFACGEYTGDAWVQLPEEAGWQQNSGEGLPQPLLRPPSGGLLNTHMLEFRYDSPLPYAHAPYTLMDAWPAAQPIQEHTSLNFAQDAYLQAADNYVTSYHPGSDVELAMNYFRQRYAESAWQGQLGVSARQVYPAHEDVTWVSPEVAYRIGGVFGLSEEVIFEMLGEGSIVGVIGRDSGRVQYGLEDAGPQEVNGYYLSQIDETYPYGAYMTYIQGAYTELPPGVAEDMRAIAREAGIAAEAGQGGWIHTAYMVAEYVKQAAVYTLNPERLPDDADFATWFLTEGKAGYCVHFATAAAVMLRALGVPARYVEGFVVSRTVGTGGWMEMPNKNAHAWVEVWVPGLGWWPVEATPGGSDAQRVRVGMQDGALPGAGGGQTEPPAGSEGGPPDVSDSDSVSQPQGSTAPLPDTDGASGGRGGAGGGDTGGQWLAVLLWAALALAAVCAGVLSARLFAARRDRRFRQHNAGRGVLEMYRYLTRLRRFGYMPSPEAETLAEEAAFSAHPMGAAQRRTMLNEVVRARLFLKREAPRYKRIGMFLIGL